MIYSDWVTTDVPPTLLQADVAVTLHAVQRPTPVLRRLILRFGPLMFGVWFGPDYFAPDRQGEYFYLVTLGTLWLGEIEFADGEDISFTVSGWIEQNIQVREGKPADDLIIHSGRLAYEDRWDVPEDALLYGQLDGGATQSEPPGDTSWEWFHILSQTYSPKHAPGDDYDVMTLQTSIANEGIIDWSELDDEPFSWLSPGGSPPSFIGPDPTIVSNGTSTQIVSTVLTPRLLDEPASGQYLRKRGWFVDFSELAITLGDGAIPEAFDDLDISGGFKRTSKLDGRITWPEGSSEGNTVVVNYKELRDLGIVDANESWALRDTGYYSPPTKYQLAYPFWDPPAAFGVTEDSLKAVLGYIPADVTLTINVPTAARLNCYDLPFQDVEVSHIPCDVDLSGSVGSRVSAWQGTGITLAGGGVGTTADFDFTVLADNAAPTLYREFVWGLPDYISQVRTNGCFEELPYLYWCLINNKGLEGACGDALPDEDVCSWLQHNYVGLTIKAPDDEERELTFRVTYKQFDNFPDDNHLTGSVRATAFDATFTEDLVATYTTIHTGGLLPIPRVCLMKAAEGWYPDLFFVRKVEIVFPEVTEEETWEFQGLDLIQDHGDRYHSAPDWHTAAKCFQYYSVPDKDDRCGGVSGHIDGYSLYALAVKDNYLVPLLPNSITPVEPIVPLVNWLFGAESGIDFSDAFQFEEYLDILSRVGNGFQFAVTPEVWAAATTDDDGNTIGYGYSFWLAEVMNHQLDGEEADGTYPWAFRAGEWTPVQGAIVKFYATLKIGGAVHGQARLGNDFGRSITRAVRIYRRPTAEDEWELVETVATDTHGHYSSSWLPEPRAYSGTIPLYWLYGVFDSREPDNIANAGRFYRRQYVGLPTVPAVTKLDVVRAEPGRPTWLYIATGTDLQEEVVETGASVLVYDGYVDNPSAWMTPDGRRAVAFDRDLNLEYCHYDGDWSEPVEIRADRTDPAIIELPQGHDVMVVCRDGDSALSMNLLRWNGSSYDVEAEIDMGLTGDQTGDGWSTPEGSIMLAYVNTDDDVTLGTTDLQGASWT